MYDIIKAASLISLRNQITSRMSHGWVPQGGVNKTSEENDVRSTSSGGVYRITPTGWVYIQAMVKLPEQQIIKGK